MKTTLFLVLLTGCAAPLARPALAPNAPPGTSDAPTVDCSGLDRDHRTWGAVAKFAGVVAGSGALASVPVGDDQKTLKWSIGVGAVLIGGLAAAAVFVEQDAASTFAKECTR